MKKQPTNLAESIRQKLLNGAKQRQEDPQFILQRYAQERFLYRLGKSTHRDKFVLKGAMLFAMWGGSLYRPTKDLDFTGYGSSEEAAVLDRLREICMLDGGGDGIEFDAASLRTEPIREDVEYGGIRILFVGRLGKHEVKMQIDVGFGNAIEPGARESDYPALLDAPAPSIRAYPQEAVVAEKLHAMVMKGEINSRYKDFYDVYVLASGFAFDGAVLTRSIAATFERRKTAFGDDVPVALTSRFFAAAARAAQWRAYVQRNKLPGAPSDFDRVGELLLLFLAPPYEALRGVSEFQLAWAPLGPWRET